MLGVALTCSPQHWEGEWRQADPMLSGHSAQLTSRASGAGKGLVLINKGENDLVKHLMSTSSLHMYVYALPPMIHLNYHMSFCCMSKVKGEGELLVFGNKKIVSGVLIMLL